MRQYNKHKPTKGRPSNKTDRRNEASSHDGFRLSNCEGSWGFVEGARVKKKNILGQGEAKAIDACCRRRGIIFTNTSSPGFGRARF